MRELVAQSVRPNLLAVFLRPGSLKAKVGALLEEAWRWAPRDLLPKAALFRKEGREYRLFAQVGPRGRVRLGEAGQVVLPLVDEGRELGVLAVYPDAEPLSEAARAFLELVRDYLTVLLRWGASRRASRVFRRVAYHAVEAEEASEFLPTVCQVLVEEGYALAWIGEALPDGRVAVRAGAGAVGYLEGLSVRWDASPEGQGPTGRALREGRPVILRDLRDDPAYAPWRDRALAHGFGSIAAFPVRKGGRVWGALNVYAPEPAAFAAEEAELLADLAVLVGRVLEGLEAREEAFRLAQVVDAAPTAIFITTPDGRIAYANPALARFLDRPAAALLGASPQEVGLPAGPEEAVRALREALSRRESFSGVVFARTGDDRFAALGLVVFPLTDPRGAYRGHAWVGWDVTPYFLGDQVRLALLRALEEGVDEGLPRRFVRALGEVVPGVDAALLALEEEGTLRVLAAWGLEAGGTLPPLAQEGPVAPEALAAWLAALPPEAARGLSALREAKEAWVFRADGVVLLLAGRAQRFSLHLGEALRSLPGAFSLFLGWREAARRAAFLARHDPETGLPARKALEAEGFPAGATDVVLVGLEGLPANPEARRAVLREAARRFAAALEDVERAYHLGGGEFLLALRRPAKALLPVLEGSLRHPVLLPSGEELALRARFGVAPAGGEAWRALRRAELALAAAEEAGGVAFFSPEMEEALARREVLIKELRQALSAGDLRFFAQPIVDLVSGGVVARELLLRWIRGGEAVPAGHFMPEAESTGFVVEMDLHALRTLGGLPPWEGIVHLNLSPATLLHPEFLAAAEGLKGRPLRFEVTEHALVVPEAGEVLRALAALGFELVLDDFGKGYASLATLAGYPFRMVKVDKAFTAGIGRDPRAEAVLRAVRALAVEVGLLLVAEGVETSEEQSWLVGAGYRLGQGFGLGRPEPWSG